MKQLCVVLALCVASHAFAEDTRLGRLFLVPAERAALESARQNNQLPQKTTNPAHDGKSENAAASRHVAVQGFVKRGDGKGTVWINGSPVQENSSTGDFSVGPLRSDSDRVRIQFSGAGKIVSLKAGESYDADKVERE